MIEMWWEEIVFSRPQALWPIGASVIPGTVLLVAGFATLLGRQVVLGAFTGARSIRVPLADIRIRLVPFCWKLPHGVRESTCNHTHPAGSRGNEAA